MGRGGGIKGRGEHHLPQGKTPPTGQKKGKGRGGEERTKPGGGGSWESTCFASRGQEFEPPHLHQFGLIAQGG